MTDDRKKRREERLEGNGGVANCRSGNGKMRKKKKVN